MWISKQVERDDNKIIIRHQFKFPGRLRSHSTTPPRLPVSPSSRSRSSTSVESQSIGPLTPYNLSSLSSTGSIPRGRPSEPRSKNKKSILEEQSRLPKQNNLRHLNESETDVSIPSPIQKAPQAKLATPEAPRLPSQGRSNGKKMTPSNEQRIPPKGKKTPSKGKKTHSKRQKSPRKGQETSKSSSVDVNTDDSFSYGPEVSEAIFSRARAFNDMLESSGLEPKSRSRPSDEESVCSFLTFSDVEEDEAHSESPYTTNRSVSFVDTPLPPSPCVKSKGQATPTGSRREKSKKGNRKKPNRRRLTPHHSRSPSSASSSSHVLHYSYTADIVSTPPSGALTKEERRLRRLENKQNCTTYVRPTPENTSPIPEPSSKGSLDVVWKEVMQYRNAGGASAASLSSIGATSVTSFEAVNFWTKMDQLNRYLAEPSAKPFVLPSTSTSSFDDTQSLETSCSSDAFSSGPPSDDDDDSSQFEI